MVIHNWKVKCRRSDTNNQSNKKHKTCSGKINKIHARPTHRKLQTLL